MDTSNKFGVAVGASGNVYALLFPHRTAAMSADDALLLAAWLVAMADPLRQRFDQVLAEVLRA